jgi:hypothetical protein
MRYGGVCWELSRLWIDDAVPANAETWLIAQAVRDIKSNHPDVQCLVSYADSGQGHRGTIYRAAGWAYDGMTDSDRKTPRFDLVSVATGKKYGRASHVPPGEEVTRLRRTPKHRYILRITAPTTTP